MARSFNGTSDYLEHGVAVVTVLPITMACWCKTTTTAASVRALITIGDAAWSTKIQLYVQSSGEVIARTANTSDTGFSAVSVGKCAPGIWNSCVGVFNSSTDRRVFLNAIKVTNASSVVFGTPTATNIGIRYTAGVGGAFMNGLIAEVAIWNVALDDADAYLLSRGYYPDQIRPGNLVSYWPLVGQYSPDEIDLKGRFDATVFGAKPAIADHPPMIPRSRRHRAIDAAFPFGTASGPTFVPGDQPPARIIFQHV